MHYRSGAIIVSRDSSLTDVEVYVNGRLIAVMTINMPVKYRDIIGVDVGVHEEYERE